MAASLGLSLGSALNTYTASLFAPNLIAEFGWSRAQLALGGSLPLLTIFLFPLAGRITDRFGARVAAIIGFVSVPLIFLALSVMRGNLYMYYAIAAALSCLGVFTTPLVFCRVVVERFDRLRGLALSLVMVVTPLVGAIAAAVVGGIIETRGWRAGYVALATASAVGGCMVILLIGGDKKLATGSGPPARLSRRELSALIRSPVFLLLIVAMFLCNLPHVVGNSQLKLILLDGGAASHAATWIVSLFAIGVVVGRAATGIVLDRVPAHIVSMIGMGLPAIGFLLLASHPGAVWIMVAAVLFIGLAQGAEGDIGAYVASRGFDMKNYSLILSFIMSTLGAATATGALILSFTLHATESYTAFLLLAAAGTVVGAALFYRLGRYGIGQRVQPTVASEQ